MKTIAAFFKKHYKDILIIILGNILVAGAASCFLNYENDTFKGIVSGGVSGFTLILESVFNGANLEFVATILTWVLFVLGVIFLGLEFGLKTIFGTFLFSGFLFLFKTPLFNSVHDAFNTLDPILASAIGGMMVGTGCGIIYRIGGSTGGFDIPPLIINKYIKVKVSRLFLIQDGLLVILALIADFSLNEVAIGLVSVLVCSMFIEKTEIAGTESYIAEIISEKYEEINKAILEQLDRGTTLYDAQGGYTQKSKKIIKVMLPKKQYHDLIQLVIKIDKTAFMSLHPTNDVFGIGFKEYKQ